MLDRFFTPKDIVVRRGIEWSESITILDQTGAAVDVSTASFVAKITTTDAYDGTIVVQFNVDPASAASGIIRLYLTEAQTTALTAQATHYWFLTYSGSMTGNKAMPVYSGVVRVR